MRNGRKEQLYAALVGGYWLVNFENNKIRINPLKRLYRPILEDFFISVYNDALSKNFLDDEDYRNFLIQNEIDVDYIDNKIEKLKENLEDLKVECFTNFLDPIHVRILKTQIESVKSEITNLYNRKYTFYHLSAEGHAEMERNRFSLALCMTKLNGKRFFKSSNYKMVSVSFFEGVAVELKKIKPSEEEIRDIARSDEFNTFLSASKKARMFKTSVFEMLEEQISLINWANLYSSIQGHNEKPSAEIINDHILFDGWLIKQKRINTTKARQNEVMSTVSDTMKNYKNIYLPANNPESAKRIYELNLDAERSITRKGTVLKDG